MENNESHDWFTIVAPLKSGFLPCLSLVSSHLSQALHSCRMEASPLSVFPFKYFAVMS